MEKGELLLGGKAVPRSLFVFDGLIATCRNPRLMRRLVSWRRVERAADLWDYETTMIQFLRHYPERQGRYFDVVTWQPKVLADVLAERVREMRVPFAQFFSDRFHLLSVDVGMHTDYDAVYDADPVHQYAYGFKCRMVSPSDFHHH